MTPYLKVPLRKYKEEYTKEKIVEVLLLFECYIEGKRLEILGDSEILILNQLEVLIRALQKKFDIEN